jgi:hypothetical protein
MNGVKTGRRVSCGRASGYKIAECGMERRRTVMVVVMLNIPSSQSWMLEYMAAPTRINNNNRTANENPGVNGPFACLSSRPKRKPLYQSVIPSSSLPRKPNRPTERDHTTSSTHLPTKSWSSPICRLFHALTSGANFPPNLSTCSPLLLIVV